MLKKFYQGKKYNELVRYACLILFASLASLSLFSYGKSNHSIIIPFIKSSLDPDLYTDDYLINEKENYFTLLWKVVAWLIDVFQLDYQTTFFIIHCLSMIAISVGIYLLGMLMFRKVEVAFLTLTICILAYANKPGIGGDFLLGGMLKESIVGLPFIIFALYKFLKKEYLASYFFQGIAFLIHPLTGIYIVSILFLPFVLEYYRISKIRFFFSINDFTFNNKSTTHRKIILLTKNSEFIYRRHVLV